MKHKLTPLILATIAVLSLAGCSKSTEDSTAEKCAEECMFIRHSIGNRYYSILEEKGTGICYLEYDYGNRHGITVMLNPDGTPRTWSDMGEHNEKNND